MESALKSGVRVCWSHEFSTRHHPASVVNKSAIEGQLGNFTAVPRYGTIIGPANPGGTWLEVRLDPTDDPEALGYGEPDVRVLTQDELVAISEEN